MRMGVVPTTLREWVIRRLNVAPLPAVEALSGMLHSRMLMAGVRLGVFDGLAAGPTSPEALAARLDLHPEGTRLLCEALVAGAYLRRAGGSQLALRAIAQRYLVASSPQYVGHFIEFNYEQWEWMGHLEDALRQGAHLDVHRALGEGSTPESADNWTRYLRGMADLARGPADEIAAKVPLPPRSEGQSRRLLDVGGGHGAYSAALCRRHLDLSADVLDLPAGVAAGAPIARQLAGPLAASRIHYRAVDAMAGELGKPGSIDAVLIFQLLHHLPAGAIQGLLCRAVEVLKPGGWIAVLDFLAPPRGRAPDATSAYTALFFCLTSCGQTYSPEQVHAWLRAAGCQRVRDIPLLRVPGQPLIVGQRTPNQ